MRISNKFKWLMPLGLSLVLVTVLIQSGRTMASPGHDDARALHKAGDIVSLETVLASLRDIKQGRVIETELEEKHGRYVYELELVDTEGKVWEYYFDAKTGELLESEQEDGHKRRGRDD